MSFAALASPRPALTLFFTYRPALDEIFSLDAANGAYYRLLNIGRYVLAMYGAAKLVQYQYPLLFTLLGRERFLAAEETEGVANSYVYSLKRVAKSLFTTTTRSIAYLAFANFCAKALDVTQPLAAYNLPGLAVRGFHRLCFRLVFKDGETVLKQIAQSVALAPKVPIGRVAVFDNTFEILFYRVGAFLYQPLAMCTSGIARDTSIAGGTGSTQTVTTALFTSYRINTTDATVAFLGVAFIDLLSKFLSHAVIPWLSNKPAFFRLEHISVFASVATSFLATNAIMARLVGPTASTYPILGYKVPTSIISTFGHLVSLTAVYALEEYVHRFLRLQYYRLRKLLSKNYDFASTTEEMQKRSLQVSRYVFREIVGRDWRDMSQPDLISLHSFLYQANLEGLPTACMYQYGSAYLIAVITELSNVEPNTDTLLLKAIENSDLTRFNAADLPPPPELGLQPVQSEASMLAPEPSMTTEDDSCAVCLKQLNRDADDIVIVTKCKHAYHTVCLRDCLNLNSKCPLCNTELLQEDEEDKYEAPAAIDENGNPAILLGMQYEYNEPAKILFSRMGRLFGFMEPWGLDLSILTAYMRRHAYSLNPGGQILVDHLRAMEQPVADLIQYYGQTIPPYTQLRGQPLDENGNLISSFPNNAVWWLVSYALGSYIKVYSFWGNTEDILGG